MKTNTTTILAVPLSPIAKHTLMDSSGLLAKWGRIGGYFSLNRKSPEVKMPP